MTRHRAPTGTLADVMAGPVTPPADRPLVFSPFGPGVLDLAVGRFVYDETVRAGRFRVVEDFFHDLSLAIRPIRRNSSRLRSNTAESG